MTLHFKDGDRADVLHTLNELGVERVDNVDGSIEIDDNDSETVTAILRRRFVPFIAEP